MAITHGAAGKTLKNKLLKIIALSIGLGLLIALPMVILMPALAPFAWFPFVVGALMIINDKEIVRGIHAKSKGYAGEAQMGKLLESLPESYHVFHDLDLGGENIDHLVVGMGGAFILEVKNYSGKVVAGPKGLWNKGRRQDKIVKQTWRQAHKLKALLGIEVVPILVFIGNELEGNQTGRLLVMRPQQAIDHIKQIPRVWEYKEFIEVSEKAKRLVR